MDRSRRRIALLSLAPVASVALLAGCADHSGSAHSSGALTGNSQSPVKPTDNAHSPDNRTVDSHSSVAPTNAAGKAPGTPSTSAPQSPAATTPEFRSTTVYGLARSVTVTKDGARLVWDKADWQFNAANGSRNGMDSCHTYDHGDVLTNCNPLLRTTDVPSDASIKLVFPGCPAGAPDIAPDPRHADRALGDAPVSLEMFAHVMNRGCQPNYPGPTVGGLWLTFDDSGTLTDITEKFES